MSAEARDLLTFGLPKLFYFSEILGPGNRHTLRRLLTLGTCLTIIIINKM